MKFNIYKKDYLPNTWFGVATYLDTVKHIVFTSCDGGNIVEATFIGGEKWMQDHVYKTLQSLIDA